LVVAVLAEVLAAAAEAASAAADLAEDGKHKMLSKSDKQKIVEAIRRAEQVTSGEIRVHLKPTCRVDVLAEAQKTFHRLSMHRAKHRNGVLIFVAPKSRRFAIVGDAGIHAHAGQDFWHEVRDVMTAHFSKGQLADGIVAGVEKVGEKLKVHFPN
jgi:uncharacterized membrane protein